MATVCCIASLIACTKPDICHLWRRKQHGDFFGITVSGYPEAHPDVISEDKEQQEKAYRADLQYLKEKVKLSLWCQACLLRMCCM